MYKFFIGKISQDSLNKQNEYFISIENSLEIAQLQLPLHRLFALLRLFLRLSRSLFLFSLFLDRFLSQPVFVSSDSTVESLYSVVYSLADVFDLLAF